MPSLNSYLFNRYIVVKWWIAQIICCLSSLGPLRSDLFVIFPSFGRSGLPTITQPHTLPAHLVQIKIPPIIIPYLNFWQYLFLAPPDDVGVGVVKKLLSFSSFVTKVPFVALKSILSNYFCITICVKSLLSKIQMVLYIYVCVPFPFLWFKKNPAYGTHSISRPMRIVASMP